MRRIGYVIPLLIGVITFTFVLVSLAPGDIVTATIGDYPASEEYLAERRAELGLDQPLIVQYVNYVLSALQGDLGYSFANRQEVLPLVVNHLGATMILVVAATVLSITIGLPLGLWAATTRRRAVDNALNLSTLVAFSIPAFWLALMAVLVFAINLALLPAHGMTTIGFVGTPIQRFGDLLSHLILPAAVLAVPETALMIRMTRASANEVLNSGYVLTAVSKGLARGRIIRRHVVRNSLLPVATVMGYTFGTMVGGSVLVEKIFGWPGMGSLLYDSVQRRDTSVVLGVVVVVAVVTLVVNVVTDVVYGVIDPKVREATAL
ncbi:ABC transporter permease [Jiangella rhizosphaerae]|uniref:ABC transporter permease n=1 Tax=Jiangella rhizosphaerae TaxID=2293569 RepID=A0A418KW86_9ACTN|nr:ABC transporter permease [Jiangella rhizosphaerae]RIQ34050.1 ABC transporter permease [Jiangella rhizosphaerae]